MRNYYKDDKYELNIDLKENCIELSINDIKYVIYSYFYEPCIYFQSKDKLVDIVLDETYALGILINDTGWVSKQISPKDFCKAVESEILNERAKKKQRIVQETGHKTAMKLDEFSF